MTANLKSQNIVFGNLLDIISSQRIKQSNSTEAVNVLAKIAPFVLSGFRRLTDIGERGIVVDLFDGAENADANLFVHREISLQQLQENIRIGIEQLC